VAVIVHHRLPEAATGVDAMAKKRPARRWVRTVKTDSTHPPSHTFSGSASQIARTMARKDVSPKGLGSAIRMIQYFINRGGRRLSASRRRELEQAKRILQQRRQSA
jgi:tRNA(adenine34) deaminase